MKRLLMLLVFAGSVHARGEEPATRLVAEAKAAEIRLESQRALELYLQAGQVRPDDAFILQKIARQYSDLVLDQPDDAARRRFAQSALDYSLRAVASNPRDAVSVLSVAISYGKLAVYSDLKAKLRYSRLVKEEAERALALDPDYAWAHHVLGRWHHEVASLGLTSRWVVSLFLGGLPPASQQQAVGHLRRAVALEPDELAHHLELGFALAAAEQPQEARQAWQRGLQLASRGKHDEPAKQRARAALEALR